MGDQRVESLVVGDDHDDAVSDDHVEPLMMGGGEDVVGRAFLEICFKCELLHPPLNDSLLQVENGIGNSRNENTELEFSLSSRLKVVYNELSHYKLPRNSSFHFSSNCSNCFMCSKTMTCN